MMKYILSALIITLAPMASAQDTVSDKAKALQKYDSSRVVKGDRIYSRSKLPRVKKYGSNSAVQLGIYMREARDKNNWERMAQVSDKALARARLSDWATFEFTRARGLARAALGQNAAALVDLRLAAQSPNAMDDERARLLRQIADIEQGLPVLERNWEPRLIKSKPAMAPKQAFKRGLSGRCIIGYDIKENGRTTNIEVIECTDKIFRAKSKLYVSNRRYAPEYVDGQAVASSGHQKMVEILLKDRQGRLFPYKRD